MIGHFNHMHCRYYQTLILNDKPELHSINTSPGNWNVDFYQLGTTQGYHSLPLRLLKPSSDNVLNEHSKLPQVFPLTVQLIFSSYLELRKELWPSVRVCITHPSWIGHLPKIVTGEVVYSILSGTHRAPQKCFWSGLRVQFSGENHLLLICEKMPNQTLKFFVLTSCFDWLCA